MRSLLTVEDAIELQRDAFLALARDRTTAAPNWWLRLRGDQRGWLKMLAAHDETSGGLGVKVLARFPRNPPGRNLGSLLLLFDEEDGTPLAVMDSVYITAVRTAAGAAVATEALARPEPASMAIVGTGVLAWYTVLAHRRFMPTLKTMRVYSRSAERRDAFAERVRTEVGLEAQAVSTVADAVAGADLVITATNAPDPVLMREHLSPGQRVNAIGIRTEIAPDALAACRVIGDGREETLADGKFSVALAAGAVLRRTWALTSVRSSTDVRAGATRTRSRCSTPPAWRSRISPARSNSCVRHGSPCPHGGRPGRQTSWSRHEHAYQHIDSARSIDTKRCHLAAARLVGRAPGRPGGVRRRVRPVRAGRGPVPRPRQGGSAARAHAPAADA